MTFFEYSDRLKTADSEAKRLGIRSIPAFVFDNDEIILGALSPDIFRNAFEDIENGTYVKTAYVAVKSNVWVTGSKGFQ